MNFEELMKTITFKYPDVMMSPREVTILYNAVLRLKPKVILELGTGYGTSTSFMALAAKQVGGKVYSCDKTSRPNIKENLDALNLDIELLVMDDLSLAKIWDKKVDLLYIDTDHGFEQTKSELEAFIPFLSERGECFIHDVLHMGHYQGEFNAVMEFIQNYKSEDRNTKNIPMEREESIPPFIYEIFITSNGMGRLYKDETYTKPIS